MFARTSRVQIPSNQIDKFLREIDSHKSQIMQMPGYVDGYWMIDHKSGKSLAVTLFDSEKSLRDSEDMATRTRMAIMNEIGVASPPPFEEYEVGVEVAGRMRKAA